MKYPVWIVRPSLNDETSTTYFSLEAATAEGEASGLYLDFEEDSDGFTYDFDVDDTTWGSASEPHGFALETSKISDKTTASFKIGDAALAGTVDGYSDWSHILTESGMEMYASNSNAYLVSSISSTSEFWCYLDTTISE